MMRTLVMVHGAGDGAWVWTPLADRLRTRGHRVFTVTLTGYGERRHLASPEIRLETHVQDVQAVIEYERLKDVWLVGHSYGGWVTTLVAERVADRLAHLVYVDALVPMKSGQRYEDFYDPAFRTALKAAAGADAWLLPVNPDLTDPRYGPVLSRPLKEPVDLSSPEAAVLPRTYLAFTARGDNPRYQPVAKVQEFAVAKGWRVIAVPADHNAHFTRPDLIAPVFDQMLGASPVRPEES
jgi:pimeloyl-ACP methyl ester carboxylesterase